MNFKFYHFLLLFVTIFSTEIYSQEIIYGNDKNESVNNNESIVEKSNPSQSDLKPNNKVSYNLDLGTSFSTSKAFGNALSFYARPELKYKLAPKINITAGFMMINTSMSNYYSRESQRRGSFNQAYVFTGVEYHVNPKLIIGGELLYGINKSPYRLSANGNSQDYMLKFNAEYKINENFSIGVQVINQNMGYPAYGNPYGYNNLGNSYLDPFGR